MPISAGRDSLLMYFDKEYCHERFVNDDSDIGAVEPSVVVSPVEA